jgi:hypothetical protein
MGTAVACRRDQGPAVRPAVPTAGDRAFLTHGSLPPDSLTVDTRFGRPCVSVHWTVRARRVSQLASARVGWRIVRSSLSRVDSHPRRRRSTWASRSRLHGRLERGALSALLAESALRRARTGARLSGLQVTATVGSPRLTGSSLKLRRSFRLNDLLGPRRTDRPPAPPRLDCTFSNGHLRSLRDRESRRS